MATFCAKLISKHMNVPVSLITSSDDIPKNNIFDQIIKIEKPKIQQKKVHVGFKKREIDYWFNHSRVLAYDLSPYDETILIDADFLIFDNSLNELWGSKLPIRMYEHSISCSMEKLPHNDRYINELTIPLRWATVVYFNKDSEDFWILCKKIQENYEYYCRQFFVQPNIYRNDFVFSIANHIFWGYDNMKNAIPGSLLTSKPTDKIMHLNHDYVSILANDNNGYMIPMKINSNVHIMNKFSLMENINE